MIPLNRRVEILPGIFLRTVTSDKFKTGCFSVNLLRPLSSAEAAKNALIPSVLLWGTAQYPDIAAISDHLDDLYGATLGVLVRKKGEVQMVGFYADFIEDCFVPEPVFAPMVEFLGQVLCDPLLQDGCFSPEAVEGERQNLIRVMQARIDEKRSYATSQMLQTMCQAEAYSEPRLGNEEELADVTPQKLYAHYQNLLATSRIEIFYLGRQQEQVVADCFTKALCGIVRRPCVPVATQVVPSANAVRRLQKQMDVTQGKLSIGLRTGCTVTDADFPALMLLNSIFGGGVTSKLFTNVREKRSLCYYANSVLEKYKGIMVISSGVAFDQMQTAETAILKELDDCRNGAVSRQELVDAKRAIQSALAAWRDAPGALDDYYLGMTVAEGMLELDALARAVEGLQLADVQAAAQKLMLDTVLYLTGVEK